MQPIFTYKRMKDYDGLTEKKDGRCRIYLCPTEISNLRRLTTIMHELIHVFSYSLPETVNGVKLADFIDNILDTYDPFL